MIKLYSKLKLQSNALGSAPLSFGEGLAVARLSLVGEVSPAVMSTKETSIPDSLPETHTHIADQLLLKFDSLKIHKLNTSLFHSTFSLG
jgi:hypothetical protein